MQKSNKNIILIIIGLIVIAAIFLLIPATQNSNIESNDKPVEINVKPTIGSKWQWRESAKNTVKAQTKTDDTTSLPFTAESVHRALQAVKLDSDGNIILDHDTLISLDEALERIHNRLDSESLNALQELIKESLPGIAGEQTAKLVGDYFQFLEAKEEFSQINETMADTQDEGTLESIEVNQALYAELQVLRETHIGYEATNSLFRVSDANALYMFESMKLESDDSLTQDEKNNRRKEIKAKHIEQSINITDWPSRYQAFMIDKNNVIAASISEEEKRKQLKALLKQHFVSDELKRIEYLRLDQI